MHLHNLRNGLTCVYPDAVLGFHGAFGPSGIAPKPLGPDKDFSDENMAETYPPAIRQAYWSEWRFTGYGMVKRTGAELAAMSPEIVLCE